MQICAEVERTYQDLSPLSLEFVRYAVANPDLTRRLDLKSFDLPEWIQRYTYALQSWPTFVGPDKLAEIRRATLDVTALVKAIPERVFRGDPRRFAAFYGLENEVMAQLLLEPPSGIPQALARVDFVDSPHGLRVLETNIGAYIGGWQLRFWQELCLAQPGVLRFLDQHGLDVHHRDPFRALFEHAVETAVDAELCDDELNVVLGVEAAEEQIARAGREPLQALYDEVRERLAPGLGGAILIAAYPEGLEVRGDRICFSDGRRAHVVVEYSSATTPPAIYHCFKKGGAWLFNGPAGSFLGRKSSLGVLSELAGSGLFTAGERELIERYVPWTRLVRPGTTLWRGEEHSIPELLATRREELVLKPADGNQGSGVHVGRTTPPDEWRGVVERAVSERSWVAQEHVASRTYVFQRGDAGCARHDVVWGTFCFGRRYGGGFLRLQPKDAGRGVINSAQGATEGMIFEVTPASPAASPASPCR